MGPLSAVSAFIGTRVVPAVLTRLPGGKHGREDEQEEGARKRGDAREPSLERADAARRRTDVGVEASAPSSSAPSSSAPSSSAPSSPPPTPPRRASSSPRDDPPVDPPAPRAARARRPAPLALPTGPSPLGSPPATPSRVVVDARGAPWEDLPFECVERVCLAAGFRSAASAASACASWRAPASSPHLWRALFAARFGRAEADAVAPPRVAASRVDWRAAFRDAVRAERRWAAGRCSRTAAFRACDAGEHPPEDDAAERERGVVGVAVHRGVVVAASLDGATRTFDAATGAPRSTHRPRPPSPPTPPTTPANEPATPTIAPLLCFAARDGVAAAGSAAGDVLIVDVAAGETAATVRVAPPPGGAGAAAVTAVAVGAGVVVAGTSAGAVAMVRIGAGSSSRTTKKGGGGKGEKAPLAASAAPEDACAAPSVDCAPIAFFRDAVTRVAIDPDARLAAAVSGADVAVWSIAAADLSNAAVVARLERSAHRSRGGGGGRELVGPRLAKVRCACFAVVPGEFDSSGAARACVVTGSDDGAIRVFDAASGALLRELAGPPGTTEAEHAGQTPVAWTYEPPPGVSCVAAYCGVVVEGRDDGSVLVWTAALDGCGDDEGEGGGRGAREDDVAAVDDEGERENKRRSANTARRGREPDVRKRSRPAAYRRWWAHADAVTALTVRGGRVVSASRDGGCHVLPLPEDAADEARAWRAAAEKRRAREEESLRVETGGGFGEEGGEGGVFVSRRFLDDDANGGGVRGGGPRETSVGARAIASARAAELGGSGGSSPPPSSPEGRPGGASSLPLRSAAPRRLSSEFTASSLAAQASALAAHASALAAHASSLAAHASSLAAHTAWRGGTSAVSSVAATTAGPRRAAIRARDEAWRVADRLTHGAVSAAAADASVMAESAWVSGVRPAVSAASALGRGAADAAGAVAAEASAAVERVERELSAAGFFARFRADRGGRAFEEHGPVPVWCVDADGETLVTADADGCVVARYFGEPEA